MTDAFLVNSRADVARLIEAVQRDAPWRVPLLQAAYDGRLCHVEMMPDEPLPTGTMKRTGLPCLVLVGVDDYQDRGPDGWACRSRLAGWASYAVVHASGGEVDHYRGIVALALKHRRLALVETSSKQAVAWGTVFSRVRVPVFAFLPQDDQVQPRPLAKGELQ